MGLDTSHDCWHGAYSAFSRWREKLAEIAGYEIKEYSTEERVAAMKAGDWLPRTDVALEWSGIEDKNFAGEWTRTPTDPLIVLIAHSDCDGVIHPEQGRPLADRIEELMPKLREMGDAPGHIGNWADKTQKFIDGLREAARAGEDVEFH